MRQAFDLIDLVISGFVGFGVAILVVVLDARLERRRATREKARVKAQQDRDYLLLAASDWSVTVDATWSNEQIRERIRSELRERSRGALPTSGGTGRLGDRRPS